LLCFFFLLVIDVRSFCSLGVAKGASPFLFFYRLRFPFGALGVVQMRDYDKYYEAFSPFVAIVILEPGGNYYFTILL